MLLASDSYSTVVVATPPKNEQRGWSDAIEMNEMQNNTSLQSMCEVSPHATSVVQACQRADRQLRALHQDSIYIAQQDHVIAPRHICAVIDSFLPRSQVPINA